MSAEEVAKAFIPHYYNVFDTAPQQLAGLFVRLCFVVTHGPFPERTCVRQLVVALPFP